MMSKRTSTELLRAVAIIALGSATVFQLVGIRHRVGGDDGAAATTAASVDAAERIAIELRRIEASGLLAATTHSIVLRVPAEVGVVCANGAGETVIAALPSAPDPDDFTTVSGIGWYETDGEFALSEAAVAVRPAASSACAASSIDLPAGTTFLAVTPAPPAAHVGAAAVLFERVEYALRTSGRTSDTLSLWRTADGAAREVIASVSGDATFRFFVDASAVATTTVPAPLARVRGIELTLPTARAAGGQGRTVPTAVFFRSAAT
jgi:hypothetical protein